MDNKSYNIRVPKRWARIAMIVGVTALIVAPLTAVATHTFNDVPNTHTFHADIEWLEASGVTKGCNPPANTLFCPDDNVTRGQMSAFMKRFAGYIGAEDGTPAQADNATNADNADTLDGLNSTDIGVVAGVSSNDSEESAFGNQNLDSGYHVVESLTAHAPADGAFVIMYSAALKSDEWDVEGGGEILVYGQVAVDGSDVNGSFASVMLNDRIDKWFDQGTVASQVVVPISAGEHTVDLKVRLQTFNADDTADVWGSSLVVFWVPSGSFSASAATSGSDSGSSATP